MKKILIVEDDQLVATAYKKRFGEAGYEVDWAPDGIEGIKMVGTKKPDIVLLDLLMHDWMASRCSNTSVRILI